MLVRLTPSAVSRLDAAEVERRGGLRLSLSGWSVEDRARFAELLTRFVDREDLADAVASLSHRPA